VTVWLQILTNQGQLYNAIGILGATCEWPHALYILECVLTSWPKLDI
jgi:hypothetical protein